MWKLTMTNRLLLSPLLLLAIMSMVTGAPAAAGGSPSWCVCRPDGSDAALQRTLDYACGSGADCGPLRPGGQCHGPDTLLSHCSYAANSYYFHRISESNEDATCDFGGAAMISEIDPSSKNCTYPAISAASPPTYEDTTSSPPEASKAAQWCVCKPGLSDTALQGTLDYACGHGADCKALNPGGQCHDPDTLLAHCSYAANSYFQSNENADCDFGGTAALSSTDPSSGTCKYPAMDNGNAMIQAIGKMLLLPLCIGSTACFLYLLAFCLMQCWLWFSTRAKVPGGAAVDEETSTTASAEESPVRSICGICFLACTNQGLHRKSCISCGHIYGRSCLVSWWEQRRNSTATCPTCRKTYKLEDIINLHEPQGVLQS